MPSPPSTRASIIAAGKGFTTSNSRKRKKVNTAAPHVPGTSRPATAMPATSSTTMAPWSWPPRISSARPAAHTAAAANAATSTNAAPGDHARSPASAGSSGSATSEPTVPGATGA